jgi:DNA-binding PadR family transcriptional regulator
MSTINEQRFLILTALASGPRHGYGLSDEIAELTDGESRPRAGALYHALDRLAADGLVAADREEIVDGRLRRYYAITATGCVVLKAEATKRQRAAQHAFNRLGELA